MKARYRKALPQLGDALFVTDGGIETALIFNEGIELPDFAAFDLFHRPGGEGTLRRYYAAYVRIAMQFRAGMVLESATWRASTDWGARLGYSAAQLADANRQAIRLLEDIGREHRELAMVISGCVGPRGDAYSPTHVMSADESQAYHREQITVFSDTAADMVSAITMNYAEEAIGIARAAQETGMPAAISFTVETDGRLPTGQRLQDAIQQVDDATGSYPAYYMLNCAHPEHFEKVLEKPWARRIRGLRANASRKSHAELNESTELDIGNPAQLGVHYATLKRGLLPNLNVVGGCCGTDHRHVQRMAAACAPLFRVAA
ncbi:MAG TPA: homocysteine S-methyltransferase family protein [Burkholderiales bacterium]|nr:homocysteine S-methyltransferase family protein [Burkholderiales bacterium]